MIDFYDIEIRFISVGLEEWSRLPGHDSMTLRIPRAHVRLRHPDWMGEQMALILGDHLRLQVCPAKVLGRWNAYGTNDLRKAVAQTAPLVLKALHIDVASDVRHSLRAGEYVVREVHIAEQFYLPNYGTTDFLTKLRQRIANSHHVQRLQRGEGFRVNAHNRRCQYLFYNKHVEIHNRAMKRFDARLLALSSAPEGPGMRAMGIMLDRSLQLHLAALGPRLEVRLGDQFFRVNPLAHGHAWVSDTADVLFRKESERLRLPPTVHATWARRTALQRLALQEFRTYLLWEQGQPLSVAAGSAKTISRHAEAIERVLGLDIRHPASSVLGNRSRVDARKVFAWQNRITVGEIDLDRDLGSLDEYRPDLG